MTSVALVYFVSLFVFVFNVMLVARVLMSYFVQPQNRLFGFLVGMTEPLLDPVRRVLPASPGLDLAPLATFFLLQGLLWLVERLIPGLS